VLAQHDQVVLDLPRRTSADDDEDLPGRYGDLKLPEHVGWAGARMKVLTHCGRAAPELSTSPPEM